MSGFAKICDCPGDGQGFYRHQKLCQYAGACVHGVAAKDVCGECVQKGLEAAAQVELCGHGYPRDTCQRCKIVRGHVPLPAPLPKSGVYDRDRVNHPAHYGGAENPYEAIKVIEAWGLGFCLGNAVKYICRAGKKEDTLEDLRKAAWYLNREIERLK